MKPSKESGKGGGGRGGGGQLLQELEALSQALYKAQIVQAPTANPAPRREFDQMGHRRRASEVVGRPQKAPPNPSALDSRHSISDIGRKNDKELEESSPLAEEEEIDAAQRLAGSANPKKGFWNWKPLRALSHIGQQRFPCQFSAHVHGIEKLPASMNGLRLQVQLRHRDTGVQTMPARVSHGVAEFQEILHFRCTIYGSKSKSSGTIKYMAKSFTLSVVAMDVEELDLGKHQLDLSRILPSQESSAAAAAATTAWNTSFKLSGKAKGSALSVTFGYEILEGGGGSSKIMGSSGRFGQSPAIRSGGAASRSFNSLPNSPHGSKFHKKTSSSVADFGSPAASEPGNESEYADFAGMDHFKLDDPEEAPPLPPRPLGLPPPPPTFKAIPATIASNTTTTTTNGALSDHRRGRSLFPEIDAGIAPGTPGRGQEREQKEQQECLDWLDTQQPESVLYVAFGSIATLSQQEFTELALGLEASKVPFLLTVRPPQFVDKGDTTELVKNSDFYKNFVERTKGRGLVVSWAPQREVLAHRAVAGFVSHCGWNSVLESVSSGVPIICWPRIYEQVLNRKIMVESCRIAVEVSDRVRTSTASVKWEEIAEAIARIYSDEARKMRALEFRDAARNAAAPGGNSYNNLLLFTGLKGIN